MSQICIFNNEFLKNFRANRGKQFCTLCTGIFYLCAFRSRSRSFHDVKWRVLQLYGRRENMMTNFRFFLSSPIRSYQGYLVHILPVKRLRIIENYWRNAKLHFQMMSSLSSISFLTSLNCRGIWHYSASNGPSLANNCQLGFLIGL